MLDKLTSNITDNLNLQAAFYEDVKKWPEGESPPFCFSFRDELATGCDEKSCKYSVGCQKVKDELSKGLYPKALEFAKARFKKVAKSMYYENGQRVYTATQIIQMCNQAVAELKILDKTIEIKRSKVIDKINIEELEQKIKEFKEKGFSDSEFLKFFVEEEDKVKTRKKTEIVHTLEPHLLEKEAESNQVIEELKEKGFLLFDEKLKKAVEGYFSQDLFWKIPLVYTDLDNKSKKVVLTLKISEIKVTEIGTENGSG